MAKRFNNLYLLVILAALVAVFFVLQNTKTKKSEKTFDTEFVSLDTAQVDQILLYLKAENHEEIKLFKQDGTWKVQKGNIISNAQPFRARGVIAELAGIKPLRLAAKSKERWEEYQLTDSLGSRIKILNRSGEVALDLMIGKLSFLQNPNQPGGFGGGNNAKGISYVRQTNQDEIYAVDGYLPMTFNQNFNSWRDGTFLKSKPGDITRITLDFPADTGFVLSLIDSTWTLNGEPVDDEKMQSYLGVLANRNNNSFDDSFTPSSEPDYTLLIEGNNMNPITVSGYNRSATEILMHSSLNPDSYVVSTPSGLFKDIFRGRNGFVEYGEKI